MTASGQTPASSSDDERQAELVARFMSVLERRPRPGTALDRVYGHHVQNGTLDELLASLNVDENTPDSGAKLMILGLLQQQRGQAGLAVQAFEKAEALLSDDAIVSYQLGKSLLAVGRIEDAAAAFERAIERQPARNEALPIFTDLGRLYGRAGQSEKALLVWEKLEKLFPGDLKVGGQIARTLSEEGDYQSALDRYQTLAKTARQAKQQVAFAIQAAEMKRQLGNPEESTADLEAIQKRLRPGSWLYNNVRQRIEEGFLKSGDYDALATYYENKLAETPDNLELQIRLGRIYITSRRLDDAEETLRSALAKAPDNTDVRLTLIDVLRNQGEMAAAAQQYAKLNELDPGNPDYLLRWGKVLLEDSERPVIERNQAAAEIWMRLADERSKDAVTLSQIADAMRSIDQTDRAIELYQKAITADESSPQYREYLGEYFFQLDRKSDAFQMWESIASDDRRDAGSLVRLAEIYQTFKETDRALQAWSDASEYDLTFDQELRFTKLLRESEKFDEAFARLQHAAELAETPDEKEQLLRDQISTYAAAGTLTDEINKRKANDPSAENQRILAMLHAAAGDLTEAYAAIDKALQQSPDSIDILLIAAEIAERQNRIGDAAEKFKHLAKVDTRFRSNHLQRVAELQMRLGQVDQAIETCNELIKTNPASAESYQFLARHAFRMGRDDTAITALRKAMTIAPRDNLSRRMLASAFADRYRTDEAIEVYWQAIRYTSKLDEQLPIIQALAPLYDRKTEVDELIRRIEEMRNDDVDERSITLLTAAAYESIEDYGSAIKVLDPAVANAPRDVPLLENMVRVCDLASEVTDAAEYQQRITGLEDTPENRFKLVQLQLDAGLIDIETALTDRISLATDPGRLGNMIRGSVRRSDTETAIAICKAAIKQDPTLWDVKLALAQLLIDSPLPANEDGEISEEEAMSQTFDRVIELINEVRQMQIPVDTKAPTMARQTTGSRSNASAAAIPPTRWYSHNYTFARKYRLGSYRNSSYSTYAERISEALNFGHAKVIAATLEFVAIYKQKPEPDANKQILELLESKYAIPQPSDIDDASTIWEHRAIMTCLENFTKQRFQQFVSQEYKDQQREYTWRLAELDPTGADHLLRSMLFSEYRRSPKKQVFTDKQLNLVKQQYQQAISADEADKSTRTNTTWQTVAEYKLVLANQFELRNEPNKAAEYALTDPSADASMVEILNAVKFYASLSRQEESEALIPRLLPAARNDELVGKYSGSSLQGLTGTLRHGNNVESEIYEKHKRELFDACISEACNSPSSSTSGRSKLTDGTATTYVRSSNGGYYNVTIKCPLSSDLIPQQAITELSTFLPGKTGNNSGNATFNMTDEIVAWLDEPVDGATDREQKTRRVLAAYAHWWNEDALGCYQRINQLCNDFPEDIDLKIEQARLASEVARPKIALEKLDSFEPLDSAMLVRKEMAAMNLASRIGDADRARTAAERLFGLRIDTMTQLALAEQMRQLGMQEQSKAMMQRLRGGKRKDERTEIQIANAFLSSGDKEAAAEVAYSVLQRLNSGRSGTSNADYYRRQVVSILRSAEKLDQLIERAERRVKLAPNSVAANTELMELYTAAGQKAKADELAKNITKSDDRALPTQLLARAAAFKQAGNEKEAVRNYLLAYEKDPSQFSSRFYDMYTPARQLTDTDFAYEILNKMDPRSIPSYRIDELIRMGRNKTNIYSDQKRKFIRRMITRSDIDNYLFSICQQIPASEREKLPEVDKAIMDSASGEQAFSKDAQFWQIRSYMSDGKAKGGLDQLLPILERNKNYRQLMIESAQAAISSNPETQGQTGKLVLALINLSDEQSREDSYKTITTLFNEEFDQTVKKVSVSLIWQVGLMLEDDEYAIDDKTELLLSIYRAASSDPGSLRTAIRYSPEARLIYHLNEEGLRSEARDTMLRAFARIDHSEDNVHNPGYGDYQELNEIKQVADMLAKYDFPIDAYVVYQGVISAPDKFERARRWGGSSNTLEQFTKASDKAKEAINSEAAVDYLKVINQRLLESDKIADFRLMDIKPAGARQNDDLPSLILALQQARSSDEGRATIELIMKSLQTALADSPDVISLAALQLVLALEPSIEVTISEPLDKLVNAIPDEKSLSAAVEKGEFKSIDSFNDLLVPMLAAKVSDHPDAASVTERLSERLGMIASLTGDRSLELAVMALGVGTDEKMLEALELLEKNSSAQSKLNSEEVQFCLGLANSFAKRGKYASSAKALRIGLQHGLPITLMTSDRDPFAISQNRSQSYNNTNADSERDQFAVKVHEIIKNWSSAFDTEDLTLFTKVEPAGSEEHEVDAELAAELAETLLAITVPENSLLETNAFPKRIASNRNYDNYNNRTNWTIQSASIAMARLSDMAGTTAQMIEEVQSRRTSALPEPTLASIVMDLAFVSKDEKLQHQAIDEFAKAVDAQLPSVDSEVVATQTGSVSITQQMQMESYQKSDRVDLCMRTLWPIVNQADRYAKEDVQAASQLLTRTQKLIASDQYTLGRHREIARRIEQRLFTTAVEVKDEKTFSQQLESQVESFFKSFGF
ncbi:tetratricopeptide repeat protein [Stieleria sp. JC731]|uniref:tetratricopeptide repeat protein n=1 Tax=Pirellulaceae TaxID=2691357 RepID=UPI001E29B8D8|nr:tetratricopeptide repeat protein [Stieleria sp. JC731]MCC9599477.1 tetratricopeptide repeat protein [Stieleria sp. JC731]